MNAASASVKNKTLGKSKLTVSLLVMVGMMPDDPKLNRTRPMSSPPPSTGTANLRRAASNPGIRVWHLSHRQCLVNMGANGGVADGVTPVDEALLILRVKPFQARWRLGKSTCFIW